MKERPILFSAPMVRAILAGTKSQTRRAVKPVGRDGGFVLVEQESGAYWPYRSDDGETTFVTVRERGEECLHEIPMSCPYGQPGDRLWVRETFAIVPRTAYRCSEGVQQTLRPEDDHDAAIYRAGWDRSTGGIRWRPSIHMPRWASRITLGVTGVRVERLQDISEADAVAEGAPSADLASGRECIFPHQGTHRWGFRLLWESINGAGRWDANPWVWVLEFRRIPTAGTARESGTEHASSDAS